MHIKMNLTDIEQLTTPTLTPAQVGLVLGMTPNSIRWQAREDASKLGFPVIVVKSRTYIPREAFIRFMKREQPNVHQENLVVTRECVGSFQI